MVNRLKDGWYLYLIPIREVFCSFYEAMKAFRCHFGQSELSRNLHDAETCKDELKLIWLERDHPKAAAVAELFSGAGFPEFNQILSRLVKDANGRLQSTN